MKPRKGDITASDLFRWQLKASLAEVLESSRK